MGNYAIKDLEIITGIKAHTIRIWEKRYDLIVPDRTDTNIRTYDDLQLQKLLQVSLLNKEGLKISKIAKLSEREIQDQLKNMVAPKDSSHSVTIEQLTISMLSMDEGMFEGTLNKTITNIGFDNTMKEVIYPFMERIGVLWIANVINPAQEHFMSNLIRQKIVAAIDEIGPCEDSEAKTVIAFLHEKEMHEIGLLYYTYHLKLNGYKIIYLGQMVPYVDVVNTCAEHSPKYILTCFVAAMEGEWLNEYLTKMSNDFREIMIWAGGVQMAQNSLEFPNITKVSGISHFLDVI